MPGSVIFEDILCFMATSEAGQKPKYRSPSFFAVEPLVVGNLFAFVHVNTKLNGISDVFQYEKRVPMMGLHEQGYVQRQAYRP